VLSSRESHVVELVVTTQKAVARKVRTHAPDNVPFRIPGDDIGGKRVKWVFYSLCNVVGMLLYSAHLLHVDPISEAIELFQFVRRPGDPK